MNGIVSSSTAFFVPQFDQGVSSIAMQLRGDIDAALEPKTSVIVRPIDEVAARLLTALRKATGEGIDVSLAAYERVFAVVAALPRVVPVPDVVIETDGEIGLDWDEGARRVLSVSVGEGPTLSFAALIGAEALHGRAPFAGTLPQTLAFLLGRLYTQREDADCTH